MKMLLASHVAPHRVHQPRCVMAFLSSWQGCALWCMLCIGLMPFVQPQQASASNRDKPFCTLCWSGVLRAAH